MKHAKERPTIQSFFHNLYISYIPNRRDNKKQVILKLFFLIALIVFIGSAVYLTNYFLTAKKQDSIIDESRKLWHSSSSQSAGTAAPSTSITDLMLAENSDFPFSRSGAGASGQDGVSTLSASSSMRRGRCMGIQAVLLASLLP